jgi:predicted transcriptional regulator
MEKNIRDMILEALKSNPQGITISALSKKTGTNRVTVSKYIYGLLTEGIVFERSVGPAKLCYLKEEDNGK